MAKEKRGSRGVDAGGASPTARGRGPANEGLGSFFDLYPQPTWIGPTPSEVKAIRERQSYWRLRNADPESNYEKCRELGERCRSSRVRDTEATYRFLVAVFVAVVSAIANREVLELEKRTGTVDLDSFDLSRLELSLLVEKLIRHTHGDTPKPWLVTKWVGTVRWMILMGCTESDAYDLLQREGIERSYRNFATHVRRLLRAADERMAANGTVTADMTATGGDEDRVVLQVTLVGDIARRCREIERLGQRRDLRSRIWFDGKEWFVREV